jgi:hypothetical protein
MAKVAKTEQRTTNNTGKSMNEYSAMMFPKGNYRNKKRENARAKTPESVLQNQCESYLEQCQLTYIRIPDGLNKAIFGEESTLPIKIKVMIAAYTKGLPDLTVLHADGRYICIELKTEVGKLSLNQKTWSRPIIENYYVIRSFEDFYTLINKWRKNA